MKQYVITLTEEEVIANFDLLEVLKLNTSKAQSYYINGKRFNKQELIDQIQEAIRNKQQTFDKEGGE